MNFTSGIRFITIIIANIEIGHFDPQFLSHKFKWPFNFCFETYHGKMVGKIKTITNKFFNKKNLTRINVNL